AGAGQHVYAGTAGGRTPGPTRRGTFAAHRITHGKIMERRILLVEDEPGLVMTVGDRLRSEGHHVEWAGDGQIGLEMASGAAFDLIILDIMLPRKNGLEVCRDLRQRGVS